MHQPEAASWQDNLIGLFSLASILSLRKRKSVQVNKIVLNNDFFLLFSFLHNNLHSTYLEGFSYKSVPKIIFKCQSFPIN